MKFKKVTDSNTTLSIFEQFPFAIKRIYFMQGMKITESRGKHAHYKNRQVMICVRGNCALELEKQTIYLNQNHYHILEPYEWHTMSRFSNDCILLILASEEYDENDYIRKKDSRT